MFNNIWHFFETRFERKQSCSFYGKILYFCYAFKNCYFEIWLLKIVFEAHPKFYSWYSIERQKRIFRRTTFFLLKWFVNESYSNNRPIPIFLRPATFLHRIFTCCKKLRKLLDKFVIWLIWLISKMQTSGEVLLVDLTRWQTFLNRTIKRELQNTRQFCKY